MDNDFSWTLFSKWANSSGHFLRVNSRPGYFYLFGENRDWNSSDGLKIFGKVRKFWVAQTSNDVHKSAAIASFQTINENKSCFPKSLWCEGSEN